MAQAPPCAVAAQVPRPVVRLLIVRRRELQHFGRGGLRFCGSSSQLTLVAASASRAACASARTHLDVIRVQHARPTYDGSVLKTLTISTLPLVEVHAVPVAVKITVVPVFVKPGHGAQMPGAVYSKASLNIYDRIGFRSRADAPGTVCSTASCLCMSRKYRRSSSIQEESPMSTSFVLNGKRTTLDADPKMPLLWAVREVVGLPGTKFGCGMALCGACTVHLDGQAIRSCVTPLSSVAGRQVTTIEGLQSETAKAVQSAWIELQVPQCGYCQSGQIMSATALLEKNAAPTDADIDAAMSGNICRCATYSRIRAAIHTAAHSIKASA